MSNRRDAFRVDPAPRAMPSKTPRHVAERMAPSVSRDVAEIAAHLSQNPVFVDTIAIMRREAMDRMANSPLGAAGAEEREAARYELEALRGIENRISGMAAEISLHEAPTDHAND
jgi:hypothetical protein